MGQATSKVSRNASTGIVVTLDALGTLYKFKAPIGKQYLSVAQQCGLRADIDPDDITRAFKSTYKSYASKYPIYGAGKLESPTQWWSGLVEETFSHVVDKQDIPEGLGLKMHDHYSSSAAYELYPDVIPFLQSMKAIRRQYSSSEGPALLVGIVTNSDPRTRSILESFNLRVGDVRRSTLMAKAQEMNLVKPWDGAWDPQRDFDFMTTSYESEAEKPNPKIFVDAGSQALVVLMGKSEQNPTIQPGMGGIKSTIGSFMNIGSKVAVVKGMAWIHVGDEAVKDTEGARNAGLDALLIDREGNHKDQADAVSSLDEVATVIKLMAQEAFEQQV